MKTAAFFFGDDDDGWAYGDEDDGGGMEDEDLNFEDSEDIEEDEEIL